MTLEQILISVVLLYFISGLLFTLLIMSGLHEVDQTMNKWEIVLSILGWPLFLPQFIRGLLNK